MDNKETLSKKEVTLLKGYLKRLGDGEDLESVRADFVEHFQEVDAAQIMRAEQELLAEGTPLAQVQRLCDVHSALFHGATVEEKIQHAEEAVQESLRKEKATMPAAKAPVDHGNKKAAAAALVAVTGHPLETFTRENKELEQLLAQAAKENLDDTALLDLLLKIRQVTVHYAKKGDLLYPHLHVAYGISGPSDVMWTVDDEIRDEMSALVKRTDRDDIWVERVRRVLKKVDEMIYKETNILFPICAVNFTEAEWKHIYQDAKDYAVCFGVEPYVWEAAEQTEAEKPLERADEIVMPGGHMTLEQLTALLNTLPLEISFVDAENINRYFNEGPKVFKRPGMAIDREVFSCHPPKVEPMVRAIIDDFRENKRDSVPVWMDKGGKTMLVQYMAVRDNAGKYLGTVEVVQDMEFAKKYFEKKS